MSSYTPAKVFASITSQAKVKNEAANQVAKINDIVIDSNKEKMDRLIQVTAVGEVSLPPDRCRITVKIHSVKDNVQDVKNSIQRRLDYVLQTFQNHNVKVSKLTNQRIKCKSIFPLNLSCIILSGRSRGGALDASAPHQAFFF